MNVFSTIVDSNASKDDLKIHNGVKLFMKWTILIFQEQLEVAIDYSREIWG